MRECPGSLFEASAPNELAYACGQPEAEVSALMSHRLLLRFRSVLLRLFRESANRRVIGRMERC